MSTTFDYIPLDEMVEKSHLIIVATRSADKKQSHSYIISEVLKDTKKNFSKDKIVTLSGANDELYKQIEEGRKKGEPVPFPIVKAYESSIHSQDFHATSGPFILFARTLIDNKYSFTNEQAYESVKKKNDIIKLINAKK